MVDLLIAGLVAGGIYALLGIGLTMVFSTTRMLNIAHGDLAIFAALTAASLHAAGVPVALAALLATAGMTLLGGVIYLFVLRPAHARSAPPLTLLIASIALHLLLVNVAHLIWGSEGYALPPFLEGAVSLAGVRVSYSQITVGVVLVALLLVLRWTFLSTNVGLGLRAAAANPLSARLTGLRVNRTTATAFIISAALAAIAGIMFAPTTVISYDMGLLLTLKGFVGAALARFTSYPITVVGCLSLGIIESLVAGYISSGYQDAIAFMALLVILLIMAIPAHRRGVLAVSEAH